MSERTLLFALSKIRKLFLNKEYDSIKRLLKSSYLDQVKFTDVDINYFKIDKNDYVLWIPYIDINTQRTLNALTRKRYTFANFSDPCYICCAFLSNIRNVHSSLFIAVVDTLSKLLLQRINVGKVFSF